MLERSKEPPTPDAAAAPSAQADAFAVPRWIDLLGMTVQRWPGLWKRLGDLESSMLAEHIATLPVDRPIYVSGLARSGSTVLLETIASVDGVATHRYRDFPLVHTPWFWSRFLDRASREEVAVERAHGDGIEVTAHSPEAMEEVLWMSFFPRLHRAGHSDVLDETTAAPKFEAFYRRHLRKLMWMQNARRYLAKGNYNLTRLEYLLKLFPDARFVIPVRDPVTHVASLKRQHARFCQTHARDARALRYMQRAGHFEFGLDRRAVDVGLPGESDAIRDAWQRGAEVAGLAMQWNAIHRHVADRLANSPVLRDACFVVRYEELCRSPQETLAELFQHCELDGSAVIAPAAARLRLPTYYEPDLSSGDVATIAEITGATAARFGYRLATPGRRASDLG